MKRDERQRRILALLQKESGVSAGELAQRLQVSRMTIHRDLQSLGEQGRLLRIHGGAVVRRGGGNREEEGCTGCGSLPLPHQLCRLQAVGVAPSLACCAACGLRQLLRRAEPVQVQVCDLLSGRMLAAEEAYFLINSMATPCCKPSLLSFADQEEIALFQAGFGGSIARLQDALEFLRVAENLDTGERPAKLMGRKKG